MTIQTFGVTYEDIQNRLQHWPFDDVETYINSSIKIHAADVNMVLMHEGITASELTDSEIPYQLGKLYVILRVAAEVNRSFTHQAVELSLLWDEQADALISRIHKMSESMMDEYDAAEHRGSFKFDKSVVSKSGRKSSSVGSVWDRIFR